MERKAKPEKQERRKKILIVDDEVTFASQVTYFFAEVAGGFSPYEAHNGEEAIRLIQENKPDVVVLDIKLSGPKDGIWVLKEIKKSYPEIVVLVMTGYDADDKIEKSAKALGADGFLLKPFHAEELYTSITQILGRR